MKAMVLAAGVGSRLDPLTAAVPKPLVPVANIPVMEHIVTLLKHHGINDIVANLHYLPEKLVEYFGDGSRFDAKIQFRKEEKLSGDAGGVRFCRDFLQDGTFLVLMGDLLTDADLSYIIAEHKRHGALASIGLKRVSDVSRFGVAVLDDDGFIRGFQEKPKAEEALSDLASTGIYVLEPEVFDYMPKEGEFGFGRQLFPLLVEQGKKVLGVEIEAYWSDVGTIEQYWHSNFDVLKGRMKTELTGYKKVVYGFFSVYLAPSAVVAPGVEIMGNVILGKDSLLEDGVVLKGNVVVGPGCVVGAGAQLEDVILWPGMKVAAGAKLRKCIVSSAGCTEVAVHDGPKERSRFLTGAKNMPLAQTQALLGTCV